MADLLAVPLKKSSDVDIVKPLKNFIQSSYNPDKEGEDYSDAINELARLRTNAIWKVFDKSSLEALYNYYDQLVALEQKIPPQEIQIPFKWKDAFDKGTIFGGRMSLTISSLAYERMCILFNIGAMQSSIAAQEALDTEESLKLAAKLLQQAAGIFSYLKANIMLAVHQEPTPDLSPDTLHALSQLMLAQAQEVIAYKCIRDEMKESMVAKVCAQCEELYTDALRSMEKATLRTAWDREWTITVIGKQSVFCGLTQFYQSQVCHAAKNFGEEIARLQIAVDMLKSGGAACVRECSVRAGRALAAARRDNDFIYHERVPDAAGLEPVPRAPVAATTPPAARWAPSATELFSSLVPLAVRAAEAASEARVEGARAACVGRLRAGGRRLGAALAARGLPAALDPPAAGQDPPALAAARTAARDAGGLPALAQLLDHLPELLKRNQEILDEADRLLREEREADEALRAQFGARWARTPSAALTAALLANSHKYRQIIDNAVRADSIVRDKYRQHQQAIAELCGEAEELPAATGVPSAGALGQLRALMAEVDELKAERDALEAELKGVSLGLRAQFLEALAAGNLDEPALSLPALSAAMRPLEERVDESLAKQESLMSRIEQAAGGLGGGVGGGAREEALGRLSAASDAYQELTANLQEATKFYNDLTQLLLAFQNKVSDFCFARKTEKEELLKDLTQEASRSSNAPVEEPAAVRRAAPPRPAPPAAPPAATDAPPAAPAAPSTAPAAALPYPTQPQGMPLPYGVAGGYPYYAAVPMYNPYATLPYPHHAPRLPAAPCPQPAAYPPPPAAYPQAPPPGYNPYQPQ